MKNKELKDIWEDVLLNHYRPLEISGQYIDILETQFFKIKDKIESESLSDSETELYKTQLIQMKLLMDLSSDYIRKVHNRLDDLLNRSNMNIEV